MKHDFKIHNIHIIKLLDYIYISYMIMIYILVRCPRGLRSMPGKRVYVYQMYQGFESLSHQKYLYFFKLSNVYKNHNINVFKAS